MAVFCYVAKGVKYWGVDTWVGTKRVRQRGFTTREEAMLALSTNGKIQRQTNKLTVIDAWELYGPISKRDVRSWIDDRARASHLVRLLGSREIESLSLLDIDQYRTKRLTEKTRFNRAPSKATLDHELKLLKRIINYAVKCGLVPSNPLALIGNLLGPYDNARQTLIHDEVFKRIVAHAATHLKPILILLRDTGMRLGEVIGLTWEQIDLERHTIRLEHQDTKTNTGRIVPLTERCVCALRELATGGEWVFPNPKTGQPWNHVSRAFARLIVRLGYSPCSYRIHDLRRAAITEMRRAGVSEVVTMRISGHKTRGVFERYNIVGEDDLMDAVGKLAARRELTRSIGQGLDNVGKQESDKHREEKKKPIGAPARAADLPNGQ